LRSRRRGVALVYVALSLTLFLGVAALVVDLGYLFTRRAEAQKAADSAALAGAAQLALGESKADAAAREYAAFYGFVDQRDSQEVMTEVSSPAHFRVRVSRLEPIFFARVLGFTDSRVGATATATYASSTPLTIVNNGNMNSLQAAFESLGPYGWGPKTPTGLGPDGGTSRGDRYGARYYNDGNTLNPAYQEKGYEFQLNIPDTYAHSQLAVEIFDPDSAGAYDEEQTTTALAHSPTGQPLNKTKYSIVYTDPSNPNLETEVASAIYDPASSDYTRNDGKWAQDLVVDLTGKPQYKVPGALKLRVQSLDGSSENGFYVRTGPPHDPAMTDAQWQTQYGPQSGNNGSGFAALGRTTLNFFQDGTAKIDMGYVPASAAGADLTVTRYDLEPGDKTILIKTDSSSAGIPQGGLITTPTGDGLEGTDTIHLPSGYQGGNWWIEYTSTIHDSSSWDISYPGPTRGSIRLVE
jgi:Flp pilus assembly protein TadG